MITQTDTNELRIQALAQNLGIDADELSVSNYNEKLITFGNEEYLVVTDSEADDLWDDDLENYIEECVLPEIPETYHFYFDNEKFKSDAKMDGRAHSLNRYDGGEEFEKVEDEEFYIYRTN